MFGGQLKNRILSGKSKLRLAGSVKNLLQHQQIGIVITDKQDMKMRIHSSFFIYCPSPNIKLSYCKI